MIFVRVQLFSSWMMVFRGNTDEEKAEGTKQSFAVAATQEGALTESSKGKPFFGGDTVGYAGFIISAKYRRNFRNIAFFAEVRNFFVSVKNFRLNSSFALKLHQTTLK